MLAAGKGALDNPAKHLVYRPTAMQLLSILTTTMEVMPKVSSAGSVWSVLSRLVCPRLPPLSNRPVVMSALQACGAGLECNKWMASEC